MGWRETDEEEYVITEDDKKAVESQVGTRLHYWGDCNICLLYAVVCQLSFEW